MKRKLKNVTLAISIIMLLVAVNIHAFGQTHFSQGTLHHADSAYNDILCFDTLSRKLAFVINDGSSVINIIKINPDSIIKAYTISSGDLLGAMGVINAHPIHESIRAYIGFNMKSRQFKLFLVPVDTIAGTDSSSDRLLNSNGEAAPLQHPPYTPDYLKQNFVLDLNYPCPSYCNIETPLVSSQVLPHVKNRKNARKKRTNKK